MTNRSVRQAAGIWAIAASSTSARPGHRIAAPHAAAVAAAARIAAAKADQEATQREQEAAALRYQYVRDTEIKQAGFAAEVEQAKARAAQSGPLAEAQATQEVIAQQTLLAQREAALTEQKLEAEVRRPADAEAYRQRTLAEAERDTTKFKAEPEAFRQRTLAEASRDTTKLGRGRGAQAPDSRRRRRRCREGRRSGRVGIGETGSRR